MAKKKSETPMPATAEPETKTKPVRLDLPLELHQRLLVVSAEQGKPMAVFAREVVEKTVNDLYANRKR